MNKSDSIKELAIALNKAQAEMSGAKKKATNPFFKSKYSDMNAVVDAIRIPFCDNGLSYSQFPIFSDKCVGVETILMHESGEWISSVLMLPMVKQDPQAAGSAITYARRYSLQSIAGIPSEDDDGNHATKPAKKSNIDIAAVAKECGYTSQQVCETFTPVLASLKDIPNLDACAAFLRSNKIL
ncbi:MAG: hypothetical protein ACI9HU_000642 [Colwellia sp.]|jgi:hypothetical protein